MTDADRKELARLRNALLWIRQVAGLHYIGEAFDPEHMRSIANIAADALAGRTLPDWEDAMSDAKLKAKEMAERLGFDLVWAEDGS